MPQRSQYMDNFAIQQAARDLQIQIWKNRAQIWPNNAVHAKQCLNPSIAAHVLGLEYIEQERIGFELSRSRFQVAGIISRSLRKIFVSRAFPLGTVRFTGAHEIGHFILHPDEILHRDRPASDFAGSPKSRPPREREADYFAACFLIPERLLRDALASTFGAETPFVFDDASAFHLSPRDPEALLRPEQGSLAREVALASAQRYARKQFHSLAAQFQVSVMTMAYRIQELKLIDES